MTDLLTGPWPTEIEVAGRPVPIRCGWRRAVRTMHGDVTGAQLLATWFGRDGAPPSAWVLSHAPEALGAAIAWRDGALEAALPYGGKRGGRASRTWDWEADGGIVLADFRRVYGIDLPTWQAHWYHFAALWSALAATEGSLVAEALRARSPLPQGAPKAERKAHRLAARAWALPVPEAELARIENERIAREW